VRAVEGAVWLAVLMGGLAGRVLLSPRRVLGLVIGALMTIWVLAIDDVIGLQGPKEIVFLVGVALVAVVVTSIPERGAA